MIDKKVRQLAAVMFTDIVGYTALMHGDEKSAIRARARHREVFQQQHELHLGEIIQYYGDGTLSVFKSAIEAAQCAIGIQRLLQEGEPVSLRIGLHLGDIVFDHADVYGDGVNFASRIQSLGIAGAVLLSGKLNDELKNHPDIVTVSLGHFKLKNISGNVEVFAISNQGLTVPRPTELTEKQKVTEKTIAVLPFVNMSASEENEYFSDGITEEIITALSRVKNLRVTSRTSSFYFKNKSVPVRQIAEELKVSTLLEGSVRLSGDKIRITAQLIHAEEDFHFWSETWDRKRENLFEIQDEVSLRIAHRLREHFGYFEVQDKLVTKQTNSLDAYEYSLKARFHRYRRNYDDMVIAISLYEKALELDPHHAESHLGLADCLGFMATAGFRPYEESWKRSAQLIHDAAVLNDQLPELHFRLANLAFFTAGDHKEAIRETAQALALDPNHVDALGFMSFLQIIAGERKKALHHLKKALRLDPLSEEIRFYSAYIHYMSGDYELALLKLNECLAHNSKNIPAHSVKSECLLMMGRYDEILAYFDTMPAGSRVASDELGLASLAYAMKGDISNSARCHSLLLEQSKEPAGFNAYSFLFLYYAVTGQADKAFEWLDNAAEKRSPLLLLRFCDPLANGLKSDRRYAEFKEILYPKLRG